MKAALPWSWRRPRRSPTALVCVLVLKCNLVIQPVLFRGKTFHTSFCNDLAAIIYNWVVDTKGSPSCGPGHRIQKDTCCIFWDSPRPTDLSHFSIVTSVKLARLDFS